LGPVGKDPSERYRVLYDDSIRVSAECPSPGEAVVAAADRWAEGDTILFRKYCWKVLKSPNMGLQAKIELSDGREHLPTSCTDALGQHCISI